MRGHPGALDEPLSRLASHRRGHGHALAEGPLRVETQALRLGHGHKKQREGARFMTPLIDVAITDQPLIHPAALLGHLAEPGYPEKTFVPVGGLLG